MRLGTVTSVEVVQSLDSGTLIAEGNTETVCQLSAESPQFGTRMEQLFNQLSIDLPHLTGAEKE